MGTVNVLDAVRRSGGVRVVVNVTSDKCYDNREQGPAVPRGRPQGRPRPVLELQGLRGARRRRLPALLLRPDPDGPRLGSGRAGNVIGGGDWGEDRLVPDIMRGALAGEPIRIRNPDAIRPWQHVLNPLSGYLALAQALWDDASLAGGWNFGPDPGDAQPVRHVVERVTERWPRELRWSIDDGAAPARGRHAAARLGQGAFAARLVAGVGSGRGARRDGRLVRGARRRRRDARDHACPDRGVLGGARVSARRAVITGVAGQDGSYLAELLLTEGYDVVGLDRQEALDGSPNLEGLREQLTLAPFELLDHDGTREVLLQAGADEIYHLAAPTFVPDSWQDPTGTMAAIAGGTATRPGGGAPGAAAPARLGGRVERGLRRRRREPAARGLADAPALALRRRQARRARADAHDARAPRPVRGDGDHLQPRVAAPPAALPAAQGHARRGRDRARAGAGARARRPRRGARLVRRARRRARRLAGAPAPTSPATT